MKAKPGFLADVMLGTLAKWLRILGYDTEYDNAIEDDAIVQRCLREKRIALTRDARLAERTALRGRHLFIRSEDLRSQIQEVLAFLGTRADPALFLTRCVECNTPLNDVGKESVVDQVPPYVYRTQRHFRRCPGCERIYWRGTHREGMLRSLLDLKL